MAEFYLDHGAYTSALGSAPTWRVPQEGDGSTTDAATSASVASIAFASAPASGTISVCGVTVSVTGVTGAATADAAANALATNINATTTAVGAAVATGTPQLRNLVHARGPSAGAPAGTCQLMMRVGSSTLNHATNSNVGIATTFSATPTVSQFAGGVGGCWGWLINDAAIGAGSSITVGAYGLLVSKPMVWTATPTQLDFVYARTQSGKTLTLPTGTSLIRGNVGFPMNLIFDTNTRWTGDSGTGVVRVNIAAPGSSFVYFRPENSGTNACAVSYTCLRKSSFELGFSAAANACTVGLADMTGAFVARGMRFVEIAAPSSTGNVLLNHITLLTARFYDCEIDCSAYPRSNLAFGPRHVVNGSGAGAFHWIGGAIKLNLTGIPADAIGFFTPAAGGMAGAANYGLDIRYEGVEFSTLSAYKVKWQSAATNPVDGFISVVLKDNKGLSLDSAFLGVQRAFDWRQPPTQNSLLYISGDTGRGQRQERWNGVADWNPDASPAYPTLAATQQDGTVYSVRLYWLNTTSSNSAQPFGYTGARRNRLADGVRTVTQEICFDGTKGIDGRHVSMRLSYIDQDGIPRTQQTFGVDPVASSASWTGIGSWTNYVARKWVLTTNYPVKQHTMVECEVMLNGLPPGDSNTDVFMDPEPSIA